MNSQPDNELRLWQLISPSLPIGAYAYSQGLEYAVEAHWVTHESSAYDWIAGQITYSLTNIDIPIVKRLYNAWANHDLPSVTQWNSLLLSYRESQELQDEDKQLGIALNRLLIDLGLSHLQSTPIEDICYATAFAMACAHWRIPLQSSAQAYLWSWSENQVAAAVKLIPLGQTAGQRILLKIGQQIPLSAKQGLELSDDDMGMATYGVAMASAMHETQYTRLFRS